MWREEYFGIEVARRIDGTLYLLHKIDFSGVFAVMQEFAFAASDAMFCGNGALVACKDAENPFLELIFQRMGIRTDVDADVDVVVTQVIGPH